MTSAHEPPTLAARPLARLATAGAVDGAGITLWHPPPGERPYGPRAVAAAMNWLVGADAHAVALTPTDIDANGPRGWWWTLAEAARRLGDRSVRIDAAVAESLGLPNAGGSALLPPEALIDFWPALWQQFGLHDTASTEAADISIVVRSMDRASLLAALDSLRWQTLPPAEVIVVLASGRAHRSVPDQHHGLTLRVVSDPEGQSLDRPHAANRGLDAVASGSFLFLDDDDLLLPDHLEKLAAALADHPAAPAAYTDTTFGRWVQGRWQQQHLFDSDFDPLRLHFENYLPLHAVLVRCTRGGDRLRFDETLPVFEDWDFWLQLAQRGAFVHVPGISALYVQSGGQGSAVFDEPPHVRVARAALAEKWRQRMPAQVHLQLLQQLQQSFRSSRQLQAQLVDARADRDATRAQLQAHDAELAALKDHLAQQDAVKQAQLSSLQALVNAREQELAELNDALSRHQHAGDMARAYAQSLEVARERESRDAQATLDALTTERDALRVHGDALHSECVALRARIQTLETEPLLRIVRRRLQTKLHGPH